MITLATALGVIAIVFGCYELLTGRMPGGPRRWLWLRPDSPALHVRLTAACGILVGIVLLVLNRPHSLVAYGVGALAGVVSLGFVIVDRRAPH